jgi:DNA-binding beta-propeller fold protein YncE
VVTTIAAHLNQFQPLSVNALSFGSVMGVAVAASKTAYVADFRNRRVLKISANGAVSVVITEEPPWSPTGVAVSKDGQVFILEFGFRPPGTWIKPRVQKISPNGQNSIIATVP